MVLLSLYSYPAFQPALLFGFVSEHALPGWTIRLFGVSGGKVVSQTAITDAGGNYGFTRLSPGDYYLSEGFMLGWTATTSSFYSVKLVSGGAVEQNFGDRRTS